MAIVAGFIGLLYLPGEVVKAETPSGVEGLGILTVSVTGAVVKPGLYSLKDGDRVAQAIELAGGLSSEADPEQLTTLNLAEKLTDGQQVRIKFQPTPQPESKQTADSQFQSESSDSQLININTASQKELETLPGIGAVRAQSIIENRPYQSPNDLLTKEVMTATVLSKLETLISL